MTLLLGESFPKIQRFTVPACKQYEFLPGFMRKLRHHCPWIVRSSDTTRPMIQCYTPTPEDFESQVMLQQKLLC